MARHHFQHMRDYYWYVQQIILDTRIAALTVQVKNIELDPIKEDVIADISTEDFQLGRDVRGRNAVMNFKERISLESGHLERLKYAYEFKISDTDYFRYDMDPNKKALREFDHE